MLLMTQPDPYKMRLFFMPIMGTMFVMMLFVGLGLWQVQRMVEQDTQIELIKFQMETEERAGLPEPFSVSQTDELLYKSVKLVGNYIDGKTLKLGLRYQEMKPGYYLISPFVAKSGQVVLVNRGWIPVEKWFPEAANIDITPPDNEVDIQGVIVPSEEKKQFSPHNNPPLNEWYWLDVEAVARQWNINTLPFVLQLKYEQKQGVYPQPVPVNVEAEHDHGIYAVTWFSLALVSLLMCVAYHIVENRRSKV